jgi:eukaryotic-like serine/threonine-protein kinase
LTIPDALVPFIALLQGQNFDQFTLNDYRGNGQFSLVFEAEETNCGMRVAVKVLLPGTDADALFEFQREADLLESLEKAENVIALIKTGTAAVEVQGQGGIKVPMTFHYHALALADGALEEIAERYNEIALKERLELWRSVARGIHQMHVRQIVHRDLKSSNCLVLPTCARKTRAQVADLGRGRDTKLPHHFPPYDYLRGRGDFRFAPPECLFAQAGSTRPACKAADLYGLGSLLFELVTGQGITSQVLGFGPTIVRQAAQQAMSGRVIDLSTLRGKYEEAFVLFEQELPKCIRQPAGTLIRQLCDPVPEARFPKQRLGSRSVTPTDLQWLLRRADIILKCLAVSARPLKRAG